ncbi:MAG: GNAT family N-acetyltransferase [Cohnella sp.]|nr:MAG: GNAT family N-acetyltransferase [Cohnella sp.]
MKERLWYAETIELKRSKKERVPLRWTDFRIGPMTEADAEEICSWRYPAPYDRYRWPAWEEMRSQGKEFGDPDIRQSQYASVRDKEQALVGYAQFFPMTGVVRLGLGLRPDCCGIGWGAELMRALVAEASARYPGAEIDLEVESWNKRAIRAYEKAGFVITDSYTRRATHGCVHICCMVYQQKDRPDGRS